MLPCLSMLRFPHAGEVSPLLVASLRAKPSAFALQQSAAASGAKRFFGASGASGDGAVALLHQKSSMGAASAEEAWTIHTLAGQEAALESQNNLAI